jgi:hypothetical protein
MNDADSLTDKDGLINLCALAKACLIAAKVMAWITKKKTRNNVTEDFKHST